MKRAVLLGHGDLPKTLYQNHIDMYKKLDGIIQEFVKLNPNRRNYADGESYLKDREDFKRRLDQIKGVWEELEEDLIESQICMAL